MYMTVIEQVIPIEQVKKFITRNSSYLIISSVLAVALFGGWYYVRVHKVQQNARAHATLTEVLAEVSRAIAKPDAWADVEIAARTGYRQHPSSSLAPYFLAIEADALLQQDKAEEGIKKLTEAVAGLATSDSFYDLYQLKLARLHLATPESHKQGLSVLQQLAGNAKSLVNDEALYRLGVYYVQDGKLELAKSTLQNMLDTYKNDTGLAQSPWVPLAQEQLEDL